MYKHFLSNFKVTSDPDTGVLVDFSSFYSAVLWTNIMGVYFFSLTKDNPEKDAVLCLPIVLTDFAMNVSYIMETDKKIQKYYMKLCNV